ncbi:WGxxGxxG family protein [Spirosoma linguale]|uniref:MYXO-CTERM domain-containing protein n=1 Tax=Spirosoma linguale (strain ATCC 33905 / DSM 74 / LMG 10896 / Claus 1) TaxID=504472 RepID=D2QN93_SPILD|nr:hypothetical protein Slin_3271 [Spirosoma linguale DSM 74]
MKKIRATVPVFFLAILLSIVNPVLAQTRSDQNSDPYAEASQNDRGKDNSVSLGWIGLLGLAGLLGLRRRKGGTTTTTMRTVTIVTSTLILGATLATVTPANSQNQSTDKGLDDDNTVHTGQRDTEDHETNYDWVGFFGLAGLVGVIGPRQR